MYEVSDEPERTVFLRRVRGSGREEALSHGVRAPSAEGRHLTLESGELPPGGRFELSPAFSKTGDSSQFHDCQLPRARRGHGPVITTGERPEGR